MQIARFALLAAFAVAAPLAAGAEDHRVCQTDLGWCEMPETAPAGDRCSCVGPSESVAGFIVDMPRTNPLTELDNPPEATRSVAGGFATRAFAGPTQVPPAEYRAYGLVVFKTRPSRFDRDRFLMMCEAYTSALAHSREVDVPKDRQMVTVWPISRDEIADQLNLLPNTAECENAVDHYGLVQAHNALRILNHYAGESGPYDTSGRGPFLVAWTPGAGIAEADSVALLVDMSHVDSPEQALRMLTLWHDKIQSDPSLWEEVSVKPRLIDAIRRFFDENGVILEALGSL